MLDDQAKMAKLKRELAEREKEKLELLRKVEELISANQVNFNILNVCWTKVEELITANQVNFIILNVFSTKVKELITANQVNFNILNVCRTNVEEGGEKSLIKLCDIL